MQTSAFLRPLPPHVCKCLQLGTPSPPKNCGRPLWTAPKYGMKKNQRTILIGMKLLSMRFFLSIHIHYYHNMNKVIFYDSTNLESQRNIINVKPFWLANSERVSAKKPKWRGDWRERKPFHFACFYTISSKTAGIQYWKNCDWLSSSFSRVYGIGRLLLHYCCHDFTMSRKFSG